MPTASAKTLRPTPAHSQRESVKETVESVVVAFILAFVFRAFVIEAFVIPTGSMAATLYGEHWSHTCSDCGYSFAVGVNREPRHNRIANSPSLTCPNCAWDRDELNLRTPTEAGDRILVFKWPLEFSRLAPDSFLPKRWDVTVFKDPADGTTNFIKRLVGMPNEVLEILDGDIYTAPIDRLPRELVEQLNDALALKRQICRQQMDSRRADPSDVVSYRRLAAGIARQLTPYLRIQRKPPEVQDVFWATLYNADRNSRHASDGYRRPPAPAWQPLADDTAWKPEPPRLLFEGLDRSRDVIRLEHERPSDFYGYNTALDSSKAGVILPVRDLRLSAVLTPLETPAPGQLAYFELILTADNHEFRARLEPDGLLSLLHKPTASNAPPEVLSTAQLPPLTPGKALRLALANVDYQVRVRIDDAIVLTTTDDTYYPDLPQIRDDSARASSPGGPRTQAAIAASHLSLVVSHVLLERDVYYRDVVFRESESHRPGERNSWYDQPGWGTEGNPIMLGPGEYYALGDNSPQSKDSRLWWEIGPHLRSRPDYQLGTVPMDQIIGRAFFVYWPAGYKAWWTFRRGLIPNFGQMRWIE
ncbi:MAG: hypothetical protein JSU68_13165 [Phycisphaerales bacterium]|nr:MAG: hypothetical protein JSU68_13165 [Phycisphaerales bacterium]